MEPTTFGTGGTGPHTGSTPRCGSEPTLLCVVCSGPSEQPDGCCSLDCARQAEQELRCNAAKIRRVNGDPAAVDLRRTIAERNGRLTSALLRWRPEPTTPAPH
jgi:hypothetical protein